MKKEKVEFFFEGKKIKVAARECGFLGKMVGMMFKRRKNAEALLFGHKRPTMAGIHSFYVFFSFLAVWLDEKNEVVGVRRVKPFTFAVFPPKKYLMLLEIPENKKYDKIVKELCQTSTNINIK